MSRTRRLTAALVTASAISAFAVAPAAHADDPCNTGPRFSGTFVQPALIDEWSSTELADEMDVLTEACISTVVLQWTADSGDGTTQYPSSLPGYAMSSGTDVVGRLLDAADAAGIEVWLGLQVNDEWWDVSASSTAWLAAEAATAIDVADDLYDAYGSEPALAGWYLPFEMDNLNFQTATEWDRMGTFYDDVEGGLHSIDVSLPVAIAPFYNATLAGTLSPAQWETMWTSILSDAAIDVVALQDGVGAGHATVGQLATWFEATADAVAAARPSTTLIADTETFVFGPSGLQPAGLGEVVDAMVAVSAYVDDYWSFAYDHYQSPQSAPAAYHDAYLAYLDTGTVDAAAPTSPSGLSATAVDSQVIDLSWSASSDAVGVAGYEIHRDGQLVAVMLGTSTSWSDSQLDGSTSYSYSVRAFDGSGNVSTPSTSATATTSVAPSYSHTWSTAAPYTSTVPAHASYPDSGGSELTDGVRGPALYGSAWQGRNAPGEYAFVIDLGSARSVQSVESGWLQVRDDYVFLPPRVTIETSLDGVTFTTASTIDLPAVSSALQVKQYRALGLGATARYVRVTVDGGSAWTMVDEIVVRG